MGRLNQRQRRILELVRQQGFVSVEALARNFGLTPQTIRRDVNLLCRDKLLERQHGGATLPSTVENMDYGSRRSLHLPEKQRIAPLVARNIPSRSSVLINLGTTTEEVARALTHHRGLHVITNNLNVAHILAPSPEIEVIVAGGLVRPRDMGVVGEATIDFINQFRVDVGIIGVSGIDDDGTLLDFDYREVRVAQAIIRNARRVFLVADHSKFGRSALVRLGHLQAVDTLFTDRPPPQSIRDACERAETRIAVAEGQLGFHPTQVATQAGRGIAEPEPVDGESA